LDKTKRVLLVDPDELSAMRPSKKFFGAKEGYRIRQSPVRRQR
jgi:hypothetical protein